MELFHCFGAIPTHRVTASVAAEMLRASGCRYLAVNTHTIDQITVGDDLPVGYASATFGTVRDLIADGPEVAPVLNINHPVTAAEAVARARRAVELTGVRVIKLEVLDADFKVTVNDEVLAAAKELRADGLEVWPLITADFEAYRASVDLGCTLVRVMGSPIGAKRGIDDAVRAALAEMLADRSVPVMLDGGIGSVDDAREAAALGFDSILVNSCLFADGADPVRSLAGFRAAIDALEPSVAVG